MPNCGYDQDGRQKDEHQNSMRFRDLVNRTKSIGTSEDNSGQHRPKERPTIRPEKGRTKNRNAVNSLFSVGIALAPFAACESKIGSLGLLAGGA